MSGRLFDVQSLKIMLNGRFENYELISLKNNVFNKINSKNSNALDTLSRYKYSTIKNNGTFIKSEKSSRNGN